MNRTKPADTKLVICVRFRFTIWTAPPEMADRIRARWPEMSVVHLPDYDNLDRELADADIFAGFSVRPEQFALAKKLKWIHSTAAAVTQLMYPELRQSGIEVTNASGIHSVPMAEHILGMLIALARRFPDLFSRSAGIAVGSAKLVGRAGAAARIARANDSADWFRRDWPRRRKSCPTARNASLGRHSLWHW